MKLLLNALTKLICGFLLLGLLLFLPARTLSYPNAWLFLGLLFVPMTLLGCVLLFKAPTLLEKRLKSKEAIGTQKAVVGISAVIFIGGFVSAGLDFRFSVTSTPLWLSVTASVLFLLSYAMYAEVMRENAYLSRTVEVQEGQMVVDTGLYSILRHPMYSATVVMFLSIPLVLGSLISFLFFLPYPFLIALRIKSEEKLLERELEGYADYKKRVKYRLIPFIW